MLPCNLYNLQIRQDSFIIFKVNVRHVKSKFSKSQRKITSQAVGHDFLPGSHIWEANDAKTVFMAQNAQIYGISQKQNHYQFSRHQREHKHKGKKTGIWIKYSQISIFYQRFQKMGEAQQNMVKIAAMCPTKARSSCSQPIQNFGLKARAQF